MRFVETPRPLGSATGTFGRGVSTARVQTWEARLAVLAHEARPAAAQLPGSAVAPDVLAAGYAHCEAITAAHSRSFHAASALLPAPKRRAIRTLYAVCRISDDLVDCAPARAERALALWRSRVLAPNPASGDAVIAAWADVRRRFRIPPRYIEQLLGGVARDLRPAAYATFDELAGYAYGVASTVGLMSMHIIGFSGPAAVPYAVKLGVALQLTNILRDVGEDWRAGRVYLPSEELAQHQLSEADLAAGRVDDRWREFMRFQIARNRRLYAEAWPGIRLLHADGRLAVAAAGELYRLILDDIEAHDYDVFHRRAHVNGVNKLRHLPGIWWRSR
jgi:phytoene synthase